MTDTLATTREFSASPSAAAEARLDLTRGFFKSWMWSAMAMQDIRLRYRGSILGPFWLTISTLIMVAAMGVIYARLFHMDVAHYLPFLTIGLITWQFISSLINEGCQTFTAVQSVIQQVPLPFSIYAWRTVYRNLIVLAHSVLVIPLVLITFQIKIGWSAITVLPAIAIIALNGTWLSILLGMISARYRDIPPIVTNFVQVLFFVTPIFWPPEALGPWQGVLTLNPLFAAVDVVRAPLIGVAPYPYSWLTLISVTVIGWAGTFAFFARFRSRIAYWV
jgi:ABC-2 type transport system permease protein/lipopolysaccharide transport system permease protein